MPKQVFTYRNDRVKVSCECGGQSRMTEQATALQWIKDHKCKAAKG